MNELESRVHAVDPAALYAVAVDVLQLNLGLRCNMACAHCHQSSSPQRTEVMSNEVIQAALVAARRLRPGLLDVTGGAPELHPQIRELVRALRDEGHAVQVRTNLTVLLQPGCEDLPALWAEQGVRLLASLPSWDPQLTERQRGAGAFAASIEALRRLNAEGYGTTGKLTLDIASNPDGARLPGAAAAFEARFRRDLEGHGVRFDDLRVLTNMPVGRFGAALRASGDSRRYHDELRTAFNPATLPRLACRTMLAVAWDGGLYDCDFNLGARLPLHGARRTVLDCDETLATRRIAFGPHCFACTAQAGSS